MVRADRLVDTKVVMEGSGNPTIDIRIDDTALKGLGLVIPVYPQGSTTEHLHVRSWSFRHLHNICVASAPLVRTQRK